MNLILLFQEDYIERSLVALRDRRFDHIRSVHGAGVGDRLKVGLLDGEMGEAVVTRLDNEGVRLRVSLERPPPEPLPLTLVLAMPRPKMLRRCVRMVAEMGIKRLYLINSYRVEKSYWQTPLLSPERLREFLLLGLEQSRDTRLPEVFIRKRFKPFVEDDLPSLLEGRRGLLAHPGGGQEAPVKELRPEQVLLCIGPEGGFIPYEVEKLEQAGCSPVDLGERIYRVETVLPLLVGRLFR
jgi:16S rRNA (uracil1498-N3)-methyltransferase